MHACTNFSVSVTSSMDEAKKIAEYLSSRIPSPASIQAREDFISPSVNVYENYEIVWYEDILELAKDQYFSLQKLLVRKLTVSHISQRF